MIPYGCLATGLNVGMIEVVRDSKTVMKIQGASLTGGIQLNPRELHKWIKEHNRDKSAAFTKSLSFTKAPINEHIFIPLLSHAEGAVLYECVCVQYACSMRGESSMRLYTVHLLQV